MILLIDIGNTSIVLGGMQNGSLLFTGRIATHGEDLRNSLKTFLEKNNTAPEGISGAALASVVPKATEQVLEALRQYGIEDTMVINCHTDTGLTLDVDHPETVGTDMIVGAAAAVSRCGAPVIMIDMGTATTFSYVDAQKHYQGHIIMPGIRVSLDALLDKTAQLPPIELEVPPHIIGKNTPDAMKSGIMFGNAAMVDGILDRIMEAYGVSDEEVGMIATGGLSPFVMELCRHEVIVDDDLLLKGLYEIWLRNHEMSGQS
ncbi:MAG: type III pantothenate kinase [Eubacterium sp.]|nr:type III pantothenate kinase [Eubacterium sp.]